METPLDPFDRKILEFVQRDCQVNAEVIAEAVGLSASAVQRRLRRLRAEKVITAEVAIVDPQVLGQRMQFIERVGPMRQLQAGHERAVFVYNIIATDTVDELVIERTDDKRSVQDVLLAAMKRKRL